MTAVGDRVPGARRLVWASALAVLLVAVGHFAVWFIVTGRIAAGFQDGLARAALAGFQVEAEGPVRGGWPGTAGVVLRHVSVGRAVGGVRLRWTADRVELSLSPWDLSALTMAASGDQAVTVADGPPVPVQARVTELRVPLSGEAAAALTLEGLTVAAAGHRFTAGRIVAQLAGQSIVADGEAVGLTPGFPAPFDGTLGFSVQGQTNVPFPAMDTPGASAAAWQAAGGRIDVPSFLVRWGTLEASGSAAAQLDGQLQPEGRASLRVKGATEVLDSAVRAGVVAPAPASAARAVLGLLVMAARGGPISLPVVLRDRTVSLAQFPLIRLPSLAWAQP